jgi:menaquinone-dependent protoporphyrinogen oxidase
VTQRILVTYATRAGSTGEIAQALAKQLCSHGFETDVRPVQDVKDLQGYGGVVLGSAVRYGAWLPEMLIFISDKQDALARLPVALFTAHMQALEDSAAHRATRASYTQAVRKHLAPRREAFFPGKIDPATLTFFERMAVKFVKSSIGDKRDWQAISQWADELADAFKAAQARLWRSKRGIAQA